MKLIIQIPCFNEAETLPLTLKELPREVEGFSSVEWLIIDDGSKDNTAEIARFHGVDHIIQLKENKGLSTGFLAGLDGALKVGADVIVNTDADNQYNAGDIPRLVAPILEKKADIVIGTRPIDSIKHFSFVKKILQKLGSWSVRKASRTDVRDAPSGFRAISRDAALELNVYNGYTYTIETIIQAGHNRFTILNVPVQVNKDLRPSRLVKSIPTYMKKAILTIFRIFFIYKPSRFLFCLSLLFTGLAVIPGLFAFLSIFGENSIIKWRLLVFAGILLCLGIQTGIAALIGELLSVNRRLLEDIRVRTRKLEIEKTRKSAPLLITEKKIRQEPEREKSLSTREYIYEKVLD